MLYVQKIMSPPVDISKRTYVDTSWTTDPLNIISVVMGPTVNTVVGVGILGANAVTSLAGNDDAAGSLWHFYSGNGRTRYANVDKMVHELPDWRADIRLMLNTSVWGVINNTAPVKELRNCKLYQFNTTGHPVQNTWRRVGQGGDDRPGTVAIYGEGKDLEPGSPDLVNLIGNNLDGSYSREEFDWYITLNAFDYSISESIVVDQTTGDAEVCYAIDIADEYAWYTDTGFTGNMAYLDVLTMAQMYAIRGRSRVWCERFNINFTYVHKQAVDPVYNFFGPPGQTYKGGSGGGWVAFG